LFDNQIPTLIDFFPYFTLLFPAVFAAEPASPTGIPLTEIGNRIDMPT
jgi:hypothetical protein